MTTQFQWLMPFRLLSTVFENETHRNRPSCGSSCRPWHCCCRRNAALTRGSVYSNYPGSVAAWCSLSTGSHPRCQVKGQRSGSKSILWKNTIKRFIFYASLKFQISRVMYQIARIKNCEHQTFVTIKYGSKLFKTCFLDLAKVPITIYADNYSSHIIRNLQIIALHWKLITNFITTQ